MKKLKCFALALIFSIALIGCGGNSDDSKQFEKPTLSASVSPVEIKSGEQATLTWTSSNADYVEISGIEDASSPSGVLIVSPKETTTYNITAYGEGGAVTMAVTLTVIDIGTIPPIPAPTISVEITTTWNLPTTYDDGSLIDPSDISKIVVTVYMKTDSSVFNDSDIPIATSSPGATSVVFGPVDVTRKVVYYFSARATLNGEVSTFAIPVTKTWP